MCASSSAAHASILPIDARVSVSTRPSRSRAAAVRPELRDGDTTALAEMLKEDVVAYSDGGGKAKAAINPIYGLDKVTRFLLGVSSKLVTASQGEITEVNGEPALVLRLPGSLLGVLDARPRRRRAHPRDLLRRESRQTAPVVGKAMLDCKS
jgi:hypothetical protein